MFDCQIGFTEFDLKEPREGEIMNIRVNNY